MSCATCALSETCLGFILTVIQAVCPDVGETLLVLGQRAREGARPWARYERLSIDESRRLYYHIQFIGNYHRPFNQPVQLNRRGFWTLLTWTWQWFQCRNKINQKNRYSIIKMNAIPYHDTNLSLADTQLLSWSQLYITRVGNLQSRDEMTQMQPGLLRHSRCNVDDVNEPIGISFFCNTVS